jgi:hypothetical protein
VNAAAAIAPSAPPDVNLTSPADGATVSGAVNIVADASDDLGIERVWFYVDGVYLRSDAVAPYTASWDVGTATSGQHTILARAYDTDGSFSDDSVTVTKGVATGPAVTITSPAGGATVSGDVNIAANATDADGVQRVWFYVDDVYLRSDASAPYAAGWNAAAASAGPHTIRVRAYDLIGNYTDATISVSVTAGDTTAPNVTITTPSNGASVSGLTSITADVTDNVSIQRVWFYIDEVYLRSDALAPYTASWNATGAAPGAHAIRVRAYDTSGNFTDQTITVNVP